MRAHSFFHDHYSISAGESPIGHAAAVLAGLTMMLIGACLMSTMAFLPVGLTIGLLGLFIFGAGLLGHVRSPMKLRDLLDTVVAMATAAIGMTFTLAVAAFVVGFSVTVLVLLCGWIGGSLF